jgi:HlyD family secretion protein
MKEITDKVNADRKTDRLAATRSINLIGYAAIAIFFLGFGYWAATAPIAGAAIATGRIAAAGDNQKIQHLEGGIISQIHIREGERIDAGAPIITLDATQANSTMQRLGRQKVALEARLARLSAERDLAEQFAYDNDLLARAEDLGMEDVLDEQRKEFQTRVSRQNSETRILNQRIAAQRDALEGFNAQKSALDEQIKVVIEEVDRKLKLLDQGLTNRSEYTQLLRAQADLIGRFGSITAEIARSKNQIIESQEQIERQRTTTVETAIKEINDIRVELGDIEERINSNRDILDRTIVRAPTDGLIIDLAKNAVGSVVRPGEDLATILPTSKELLVSARLNIVDIDSVRPGQAAQLRLSALNLRRTPEVDGEVIFVSPDRLVDRATQEPYYEARLRILELPKEVDPNQIYPGMPVDALISTEERTFADYLLRPIVDSMSLAFREG